MRDLKKRQFLLLAIVGAVINIPLVNKNSGELVDSGGADKQIDGHQIIINRDDLGTVAGPDQSSSRQS